MANVRGKILDEKIMDEKKGMSSPQISASPAWMEHKGWKIMEWVAKNG